MPNSIFSVVIPTCRRNDLLARCLESLSPGTQTIDPASYEVIVSDDARGQTAEPMIRDKFPWVRWTEGPRRGPAANRNSGARHATGEWIAFIDDDCIASPQWLAAYRNAASNASLDVLEGRTSIPDNIDNPFHRGVNNQKGNMYWSCNLAVRRDRFMAIGGFDEDFLEAASEDMEFAHRFKAHQYRAGFFPEALVDHPVRALGWRGVWKRVLMIRWEALFRYKTDEGLHLSDPPLKNLFHAFTDWAVTQIRTTWHDIRRWNEPFWRSRAFWCAMRWLTSPYILPYYLYWVHRYQVELTAKQQIAVA